MLRENFNVNKIAFSNEDCRKDKQDSPNCDSMTHSLVGEAKKIHSITSTRIGKYQKALSFSLHHVGYIGGNWGDFAVELLSPLTIRYFSQKTKTPGNSYFFFLLTTFRSK